MNIKIIKAVCTTVMASLVLAGCNNNNDVKELDFFEPLEQMQDWESGTISITASSDIKNSKITANLTAKSNATTGEFAAVGGVTLPSDLISVPSFDFDMEDIYGMTSDEDSDNESAILTPEVVTVDIDLSMADGNLYISKDTIESILVVMGMPNIFGDLTNEYVGLPVEVTEDKTELTDAISSVTSDLLQNFKSGMYAKKEVFFSSKDDKAILTISKDNIEDLKDCTKDFIDNFDEFKQEELAKFDGVLSEQQYTNLCSTFDNFTKQSLAETLDKMISFVTENDANLSVSVTASQDVVTIKCAITTSEGNCEAEIKFTKEDIDITAPEDVYIVEEPQVQ